MLNIWKQNNGSKATYSSLITIFEQAGYLHYANEVRKIAQRSANDGETGGSGEDYLQKVQPPTYPTYKPQPPSQLPPEPPNSTEAYVIVDEEHLPKGESWTNFRY